MIKIEIPSKDILYNLYVENSLSMSTIAAKFNTSSMTVRSWLNSYGIKSRISNINLYHELRETNFTDIQKSLIIGSILGDGGLRIPKRGKNAVFFERHCEQQRMYLEWKRDLLMPFVQRGLDIETGGKHTISGLSCIVQDSYKLTTICHTYLTELWKRFYKGNGNKILPKDFEKDLNLFSIAVWVCDDGSLVWNKIRRTYRMDIHTENFSYDDNVRLCRILSRFFDGRLLVIPRKYESGIKYYISLRGKNELHRFCNTLKVFIPDCMLYKFETYI